MLVKVSKAGKQSSKLLAQADAVRFVNLDARSRPTIVKPAECSTTAYNSPVFPSKTLFPNLHLSDYAWVSRHSTTRRHVAIESATMHASIERTAMQVE